MAIVHVTALKDVMNIRENPSYQYFVDVTMIAKNDEMLDVIFDYTQESQLIMRKEVSDWFVEHNVEYHYSVYFGIIYFAKEEDKVKFILKWI